MLHTETVSPGTLELLKRLMQDAHFQSFCLVGGTAAALRMGHRISVDIDLFSTEPIDTEETVRHLREEYAFVPSYIAKNTVKGEIGGVKIDCLTHPYPWIRPFEEEGDIRLASLPDIAAMKLNAIVNSGERIKDFIDIAYLSNSFTLKQMLDFFEEKYGVSSLIPARALGFWDEINMAEPVRMMDGRLDWKKISRRLEQILKNPEL